MAEIINLKLTDEDADILAWWRAMQGQVNRADVLRRAIRDYMKYGERSEEQAPQMAQAATADQIGEAFEWLANELDAKFGARLEGLGRVIVEALKTIQIQAAPAGANGHAASAPMMDADGGQERLDDDALEKRKQKLLKRRW